MIRAWERLKAVLPQPLQWRVFQAEGVIARLAPYWRC